MKIYFKLVFFFQYFEMYFYIRTLVDYDYNMKKLKIY
jgi:hypothetical protein